MPNRTRAKASSSGAKWFHACRRTCGTTRTGVRTPAATNVSRFIAQGTSTRSARSSSVRQCAGARSVSQTV